MKRLKIIAVVFVLLIVLFVDTVCALGSWGVDETGKYSFQKITLIIKDEYSHNAQTIIAHLQQSYDIDSVEIVSEDLNEPPLILVINLSFDNENEFNRLFDSLTEDMYIENVFKDYYMTPDASFLGDIDQDGKITTEDARQILKCASGQIAIGTDTEKYLADANKDGVITVDDAGFVLNSCCGI